MSKKRINQSGFAHIGVLLALLVLVIVGLVGWRVVSNNKKPAGSQASVNQSQPSSSSPGNTAVSWSFNGNEWVSSGKAPSCQDPLTINSPVDISKATSILYPGQYRGGNYKPHGGFRFDGTPNNGITVTVPQDSIVYKGSRYIESGELQQMFILIAPCGIMYRFDHLAKLSDDFQKLADKLPEAKVDDSRTTNFTDLPAVKAGDVVATSVGFSKTNNTGVDFGVYDLRAKNEASKAAAWQKEHSSDIEFGAYAICWLNNLTGKDKTTALSLPGGDGQAGKQSDYCK